MINERGIALYIGKLVLLGYIIEKNVFIQFFFGTIWMFIKRCMNVFVINI